MSENTASAAVEQQAAVYTKSLKGTLLKATATMLHPETGEVIRITAGFRRMSDGELGRVRLAEAKRKAANQEITDQDILDYLAPLFGTRDGRMEMEGLGDFEATTTGTPEERFRQYFEGVATDVDMDVERRILRVFYAGYMQAFFRLIPIELVNLAQDLTLQGGGDAPVPEEAGDGPGTGLRLRPLSAAGATVGAEGRAGVPAVPEDDREGDV